MRAVLCLQKKNCATPGDVAKWDLIHVCVGAVLSDLSGSQTWKRAVHFYPASFLSNLHPESPFEKLWVQIWLAPIVTENEFVLNTKATITHAPFPPSSPILYPFSFCHWRKTNIRENYRNENCCLSASFQMITCLPSNCFASLSPLFHLYRFTKKKGDCSLRSFICCWIQSWNIYHFLD